MFLIFLLFLNGIASIISGTSFAQNIIQKNYTFQTWWYLILLVLNVACFIYNTFRFRDENK